jgi:hypothetical protein
VVYLASVYEPLGWSIVTIRMRLTKEYCEARVTGEASRRLTSNRRPSGPNLHVSLEILRNKPKEEPDQHGTADIGAGRKA